VEARPAADRARGVADRAEIKRLLAAKD